MLMKPLKTFRGTYEGMVHAGGPEFEVPRPFRAKELERLGLAVPVVNPPPEATDPLHNGAAERGPLPLAGGGTGEMRSPSSSPAERAPPRLRLRRRAGAPAS